jgi:hypothetical protein
MYFETTICISLIHLAVLQEYSQKLSIPLRSLIVYLVMYAVRKEKRKYIASNSTWDHHQIY